MFTAQASGFRQLAADIEGDIAQVATAAMRETAERTRDELRAQTVSAGLGARLSNTWTARAYPGGAKNSINPAGMVWSRVPDIADAFSRGATIRPVAGAKYLWIPTDNVPRARSRSGRLARGVDGKMSPRRHRAGALTPEECESRFNTDFIIRPGRRGHLLAFMELARSRSGRGVRAATKGRTRQGRAPTLTLMFTLAKSVTMPKLFDLDASATRWTARFDQALTAGLQSL